MGALSWQHLLIVLIIVLVLFGGSRLAGLGKSTGRAIKEFKEETKDLREKKTDDTPAQVEGAQPTQPVEPPATNQVHQQPQQGEFVNPVQSTDKRSDA